MRNEVDSRDLQLYPESLSELNRCLNRSVCTFNRGKLKTQALWMMFYVALYAVVYALALDWVYGLVQLAVVLAVPVLALYNGQRGPSPRVNTVMKWLFYLYYPAHLALIGWLQMQ